MHLRPAPLLEHLEPRQHLTAAAKVTSVTADNRGEVEITFSRLVQIERNAVRFFIPGNDNQIGTSDDIRLTDVSFDFLKSRNRLTIHGTAAADQPYRVQLVSTKVTSKADEGDDPVLGRKPLDGEFTEALPSGDGRNGGDFRFTARPAGAARPLVRMHTPLGVIDIRLRPDLAPDSVANFLSYANSGRYDNTFFNRAASGFILQGGALQVTGEGEDSIVEAVSLDAGIGEEELIDDNSNKLGTLSFARGGPQNLATNQFFFNLGDNTGLDEADDFDDSFYTPFAEIANEGDRAVVAQIGNAVLEDLEDEIDIAIGGGLGDVPLRGPLNESGFVPATSLFIIRRVGVRMSFEPIT